jgi:hypothetical protein
MLEQYERSSGRRWVSNGPGWKPGWKPGWAWVGAQDGVPPYTTSTLEQLENN